MIEAFDYAGSPARIVFGAGAIARTAEMIEALGCGRALVLATPHQEADAEALADRLGPLAAGVFAEAAMHTPVAVSERALEAMRTAGADSTIALGGGSTTGLGKAIAYRLDTPQIAIPTTYAGSEVTPILGQTEDGVKTTLTSPRVLPEIVIYDPELTLGLPPGMTVTSALNAVAHAAEALYARDRNPVSSLMAAEGVRAFVEALPTLAEAPRDLPARTQALYGAWLCGTVLGTVGMALHHKLCHTLGGSFDLPHAQTHAIVLPHAVAYNEAAAPDLLAPIAQALRAERAGAGLHAFATRIGAPTALRDLGLAEADLDRAADLATRNPYWNPRPVTREGVRALLDAAWRGDPPNA
ncbi:maleylacetate reductase [Salinarimonas sp.]|uniref:maleylacetate reductase n=1 Tax=Salinarimonas sp. TaxID=2766526 RepID=UPI0032D986DC